MAVSHPGCISISILLVLLVLVKKIILVILVLYKEFYITITTSITITYHVRHHVVPSTVKKVMHFI
jgi:hypothetical protein